MPFPVRQCSVAISGNQEYRAEMQESKIKNTLFAGNEGGSLKVLMLTKLV